MLNDRENVFFNTVTLNSGANNSDVIDMTGATDLAATPGLGHGGHPEVFLKIGAKGNADNTIALTLQGADDSGISSNVITVASLAATNIAAGGTVHLAIPHHANKRYFRLVATVAGTTPSISSAYATLHTTVSQRSHAGQGLV